MTFASFSTIIAVFENIMSFCMDMFGWNRKKAALVNCVIILIASMPCVLGYNVWSDLHLIGGRDVLDSEDFIEQSVATGWFPYLSVILRHKMGMGI